MEDSYLQGGTIHDVSLMLLILVAYLQDSGCTWHCEISAWTS